MITMLQIFIEPYYIYISIIFILLGVFAMGWLVVHVEFSRHFSWYKVISSLVLGMLFLGFGIHFLLLANGL